LNMYKDFNSSSKIIKYMRLKKLFPRTPLEVRY
jgi:hypothetical protein